jgi:hypothetical protein
VVLPGGLAGGKADPEMVAAAAGIFGSRPQSPARLTVGVGRVLDVRGTVADLDRNAGHCRSAPLGNLMAWSCRRCDWRQRRRRRGCGRGSGYTRRWTPPPPGEARRTTATDERPGRGCQWSGCVQSGLCDLPAGTGLYGQLRFISACNLRVAARRRSRHQVVIVIRVFGGAHAISAR